MNAKAKSVCQAALSLMEPVYSVLYTALATQTASTYTKGAYQTQNDACSAELGGTRSN